MNAKNLWDRLEERTDEERWRDYVYRDEDWYVNPEEEDFMIEEVENCSCPHCYCGVEVKGSGVCDMCRMGAHQG